MKYNTLARYRASLSTHAGGGLAHQSAKTYYKAMCYLLKDQNIMDCKDMDISAVVYKLEATKYKNTFSQRKNAFFKFCEFLNIELPTETKVQINKMNDSKMKKYRKAKPVTLENIKNTIRVIRDKKLKLSFEIMLNSGLRVSELSQIKKEDCAISDELVTFCFVGKGGNKEKITITKEKNERVFNNLIKYINETKEGQKIFYSTSYLQDEAKKRNFQCHDLRRAYSKLDYAEKKNIEKVREDMRHKNKQNTKRYLNSKVKI